MITSEDSLKETGRCSAASLVEMVAALECDYDRLETLRGMRTDFADEDSDAGVSNIMWAAANPDEASELAELEEAAGECTTREEAETRIHEDALSVLVRGDWHVPGDVDSSGPVEFELLLSTGGPAVRIRGELSDLEPERAWLEVQDWGTPWTRYYDIEQDTLLAYARCFYFGEG